jgi:integrase
MPLTSIACQNAKPKEKPYKLSDSAGLYLEIAPAGHKYWRLKYRYLGKEKRIALGVYPETSLSDARDRRDAARKTLQAGTDPSFARQEQKRQAIQNAATTFEMVALEWHENNKDTWTARHREGLLNRLNKDIFPQIGKRPIADIKGLELLNAIRVIEKRGAYELAHRALQICGRVFRYGVATGRVERDPTPDLRGALKPVKGGHYAALEAKQLPEFIRVLNRNDARLYPQTIRAMKLIMLTFVRTGEMIKAKWDEFDFEQKQWTIPGERMKMRRDHIVPLSDQAIVLLKEQQKLTGKWEWVFPNQAAPRKHMSNNTILMALNRMGYKGLHTGHGFRALAMSTIKEQLGYRHEVVDRQLAHGHKDKIAAAYDRAQFLGERKKMMQEWANLLDRYERNGTGKVLKFAKKA